MIPDNLQNTQTFFRITQSSVIGLPSPDAIRSDKFPGVRIGSDPMIGEHCVIYGNVFIGNGFRCGDHVLIRENSAIGDEVTIGNGSFIDSHVVVGDHVRIGDMICVPRSARIGSRVTIGSNVRFLNEPDSSGASTRVTRAVILEDGCTLGADVIISPGVCIGAGAFVEDGAVVSGDVPPDLQRLKTPSAQ
jgi:acetyltransferase-like isoleucine patch superfamily enzyme